MVVVLLTGSLVIVMLFLLLFVCLLMFLKSEGIVKSTTFTIVVLACKQAVQRGLFEVFLGYVYFYAMLVLVLYISRQFSLQNLELYCIVK